MNPLLTLYFVSPKEEHWMSLVAASSAGQAKGLFMNNWNQCYDGYAFTELKVWKYKNPIYSALYAGVQEDWMSDTLLECVGFEMNPEFY